MGFFNTRHDWSNFYVCVMVGRRLDMSKFTEGGCQRVLKVNSERAVQTGMPSVSEQKNSLENFVEARLCL